MRRMWLALGWLLCVLGTLLIVPGVLLIHGGLYPPPGEGSLGHVGMAIGGLILAATGGLIALPFGLFAILKNRRRKLGDDAHAPPGSDR